MLALTFRTEVGAAAADLDALDGRATGVAGLAGAAEDLDVHLHAAGAAVRVLVVAEGGAAALDAEEEDAAHGGVQRLDLAGAQRRAEAARVDAGGEAGLVGVDVADAGDAPLVEDDRLDGRLAPRDGAGKEVDSEALAEGLWAEAVRDLGEVVDEPEAAELAQVGEAQLAAVVQGYHGAQVGVGRVFEPAMEEPAGHAQVDDEEGARI